MLDTYNNYAERKQREVEAAIQRELDKQKTFWKDYVKTGILTLFLSPDINSAFFVHKDNLRKRSNLSFDERIFIKAPNNIELRMPVALKVMDGWVEVYDPYGSMRIKVNKQPEYELIENQIYILTFVKRFPMYPMEPILEEFANGVECHLKPTTLSLQAEPGEESDYKYLAELPNYVSSESEAIDIINKLQNIYRLNDYYVERRDSTTIVVDGKEDTFLVTYSTSCHCMKIAIFT